ncbi:MAG TPA: hypothetical protein PLP27_11705 [Crocinitomicaceae bacterium]|nr:hypothetical protein [Crocinitomicaceae bacterium]
MTKKQAQIFHFDLYGKREVKYDFLKENSIRSVAWTELTPTEPFYFFVPKDESERENYEKGIRIDELFPNNKTGIVSMGDSFVFDENKDILISRIEDFLKKNYSEEELKSKYDLGKNYAKWITDNKLKVEKIKLNPVKIAYRPFDDKFTIFDNNLLWRWRNETMKHFLNGENVGLVLGRQSTEGYFSNVQVSKNMIDNRFHFSYKGIPSQFPLYLYPETSGQATIEQTTERVPNLNMEIVAQFEKSLSLQFVPEKPRATNSPLLEGCPQDGVVFSPLDILDYIYAVLHSPTYREKYKEFLKIDFPRVPYPKDQETFWKLVKLGSEIREIHLLESSVVENYITQYPEDGNNVVGKPIYKSGNVYINETQYFANVPETAWNFYIGGYQPAQKWLKDRKDRTLDFEDILHYQKIIVALSETDRLMKEVDKLEIE